MKDTINQQHDNAPNGSAPPVSREHSAESISDLIRDLATDLSSLFGKEIALAKSEVGESVSDAKAALGAIATGAAVSMAGLVVLLISAVYGLSNIVAPWLAALIVGMAALLVGYMMVSAAKKKFSKDSMAPDRTLASAQKDKATLKRATQ